MTTIPGRATVTQYNTHWGQARMRVEYEGAQKSVPYDHSSHDPFLTALLDVLGRSVHINDSERQQAFKRIVYYIAPNSARLIRPDYTVKTYADGYGRWCARIVFPYGAGNTGEGERLIANARAAAQRAIRREILIRERAGFKLRRLSYEVISNSENPSSGSLASLTIRESDD